MESFKADVFATKAFAALASKDGKAAAVIMTLRKSAIPSSLYNDLKALASSEEGPERVFLAGKPVVDHLMSTYLVRSVVLLLPLAMVVVMVVLYLGFGSVWGVVLPISTVILSLVWGIGIMASFGMPLSMVTALLPILMISDGAAYAIHVVNRYYEEAGQGAGAKASASRALFYMGLPVAITALTTLAGFGSLGTSPLASYQTFSVASVYSVVSALILSLTFTPALLSLLSIGGQVRGEKKGRLLEKALSRMAVAVELRQRTILVGAAFLLILAAIGIPRLRFESDPLIYFDPGSEIRRASDLMNRYFVGTIPMQIVVEAEEADGIKEPAAMKKIAALQDYLESLPGVGTTQSVADLVKWVNRAVHEDREEFNRIPDEVETVEDVDYVTVQGREVEVPVAVSVPGKEMIAQYLFLYSSTGEPSDFERLVDNDFKLANVTVYLKTTSREGLLAVDRAVKRYIASNFNSNLKARVTGLSSLFLTLGDLLVLGQALSLATSMVLVFLIVAFRFRSALGGLVALVPISFSLLLNFGLMGWLGLPLDISTVMVASISQGIGIDYAIHYLARYRSEVAAGDFPGAAFRTTTTVGRGIVYNALGAMGGFLVLTIGPFKAVRVIGLLMATVMFTSCLGAMTLLPSLLGLFKPKFLVRVKPSAGGAAPQSRV
jgi:predicted RND superfamily exporter protein